MRKRRKWPWFGLLNGRTENIVDVIVDQIIGMEKVRLFIVVSFILKMLQFTLADMIPLRGELKREMGAFRIDVKRSDEHEGIALVATNTPKT